MTMFYYNQSYFPWNYTTAFGCSGPLDAWCMTESYGKADGNIFGWVLFP